MKSLYLICNVSVLNEIQKILEEMDLNNFQIYSEVTGKNPIGDARFNSSVWPGHNSAIICLCSEEESQILISKIKDFNCNAINENEKVFLYGWDILTLS